jgi:Spy/CpxP family protein refolding chaperone
MGGQKIAAAALLVSVFVSGALGGAVGVRLMDRRPWRPAGERGMPPEPMGGRPPGPGGMEGGPDRFGVAPMWMADRLAAELSLTDEQRDQVSGILESRQARASDALREIGPFLRAQLDSMNLEIRAILTSEQQVVFDQFVAREDERMFRRMGPSQPGIPPPVPPRGGVH